MTSISINDESFVNPIDWSESVSTSTMCQSSSYSSNYMYARYLVLFDLEWSNDFFLYKVAIT